MFHCTVYDFFYEIRQRDIDKDCFRYYLFNLVASISFNSILPPLSNG